MLVNEPIYDPLNRVEIFAGFVQGSSFSFCSDLTCVRHAPFIFCSLRDPVNAECITHIPDSGLAGLPGIMDQWLVDRGLVNSVVIVAPSEATTWRRLEHLSDQVTTHRRRVYPVGYVDFFEAFYGPGLAPRTAEREGASLTFMCSVLGVREPVLITDVPKALSEVWKKLRP